MTRDPSRGPSRPPHRHRSGRNAPISNLRFAFAALPPTVLRGKCPNCRHAYMYRTWWRLKDVCDFCEVRFERDPGAFLLLLALNYLVALAFTGAVAAALIVSFGMFASLTPVLIAVALGALALQYHACKSLYVWILWVFGFVHND